jgi:GTP cyclohydrolase IA
MEQTMSIYFYSIEEFEKDVLSLANQIRQHPDFLRFTSIYGVPKGGVPLAVALSRELGLRLSNHRSAFPFEVLVVDDIIDSGTTRKRFHQHHFACLHCKNVAEAEPTFAVHANVDKWIQYWWEGEEKPAEDAVIRLLEVIGEDPRRQGLLETPKRVLASYEKLFGGYMVDPVDLVKTFDKESYDQMVLLKNIEVYSMCEHHMLPFIGKAHVAYIPRNKVIGISKLARIVEAYSRRLQIQERLTDEITECLMANLQPIGAACVIEAEHLCMRMRGVEKQNSVMVTSSLKGVFLEKPAARDEFMRLTQS